ncbi:cell division protein FtsA [Schaedlerella arabinosiphila]|uniref:Cell division protein FtsA n=1 Tax=Schaedlerella arabinosiphila TaxID=2044587 RepID=A0A9X5C517_9FIRM|nr:cell division FtsA domain-containing protein [Schaedlerella arabinosiphila]NDO67678.1 cell division protein FtsA [Schaedlerella arabinosiphila]
MAKGQTKKVPVKVQAKVQPKVQPKIKTEVQADNMIFALDIGTRSIIGMVGVVEEDKVKIIAIEKEEHTERAMVDGQIENIEKVSTFAKKVKKRLEDKVHAKLKRVSVAAAGRALRTSRVDYEMVLQGPQIIDDEVINRLEAGAISKAEAQFDAENEAQEDTRRFYLVGYTVCQYYLDQYMISSLKDHRGKHIKVDLIATFLPSEVVESLYTTMNKIGLEVASITLEPIAAINAAIPENLRLLNLVIVDIGAGTSDIAACTGGSVTGYTMATIAGDEITESIMKEFLVDFMTAENMKAQIEQQEEVVFTDILGFERKCSREEIFRCIQGMSESLCMEIAEKVLEVNGSAPSALFLAGGGSKLAGLRDGLTAALEMDQNRVAIAGNNFRTNAFSDEYDLNNPEYATPLGIAISSGLNMINDSFRVTLNEKSAKLFRSGSFTVMNLLMMNGYGFQDMLGRSGASVSVRINGKRKVFYGMAAQPASLFINKKEGRLSDIVRAGDHIEFVPAVQGLSAKPCVRDVEGAAECLELTLNGQPADLETPLKNGDIILMMLSDEQLAARKREAEKKAAEEAEEAQAKQEEDLEEAGNETEAEDGSDAEYEIAAEGGSEAEREIDTGYVSEVEDEPEAERALKAGYENGTEHGSEADETDAGHVSIADETVTGHVSEVEYGTDAGHVSTAEHKIDMGHVSDAEQEIAAGYESASEHKIIVGDEPEAEHEISIEHVPEAGHETTAGHVSETEPEIGTEYVLEAEHKIETEHISEADNIPEAQSISKNENTPDTERASKTGHISEAGNPAAGKMEPAKEEIPVSEVGSASAMNSVRAAKQNLSEKENAQETLTIEPMQEELSNAQGEPMPTELHSVLTEPMPMEPQSVPSEPMPMEPQSIPSEPMPEDLQSTHTQSKAMPAEPQSVQPESMTEELLASQAEPMAEETWNPQIRLSETGQGSETLSAPGEGYRQQPEQGTAAKPTPQSGQAAGEMRSLADQLYDGDEKSLVQGTLNLESETDSMSAANAVPPKRNHTQRSIFSAKERTSKFPSIKEALASKGFSTAKEPAALRGYSPVKESNVPRESVQPKEPAIPGAPTQSREPAMAGAPVRPKESAIPGAPAQSREPAMSGGASQPEGTMMQKDASTYRLGGVRKTPPRNMSAKTGTIPSPGSAPSSGSGTILFYLNDAPLRLPLKKDGDSYYLMDMIEYSGIDLKQPKGRVTLSVNGEPGTFMQKLFERDIIRIVEEV